MIGPARMVEMMSLRILRGYCEWRRGTLAEGARADITRYRSEYGMDSRPGKVSFKKPQHVRLPAGG